MSSIRVMTKVESETLHLPELKAFVGKVVEIEVTEQDPATAADPWQAAVEAAATLTDYDFDAWADQRDFDRENHLG